MFARDEARKLFRALPQSAERDSVLGALGRMGKSSLKHKIRHRAKLVLEKAEKKFPELEMVCDEAVNCRNFYVHGSDPVFDYEAHSNAKTDHSDGFGLFLLLISADPAIMADPQGRRWYDIIVRRKEICTVSALACSSARHANWWTQHNNSTVNLGSCFGSKT